MPLWSFLWEIAFGFSVPQLLSILRSFKMIKAWKFFLISGYTGIAETQPRIENKIKPVQHFEINCSAVLDSCVWRPKLTQRAFAQNQYISQTNKIRRFEIEQCRPARAAKAVGHSGEVRGFINAGFIVKSTSDFQSSKLEEILVLKKEQTNLKAVDTMSPWLIVAFGIKSPRGNSKFIVAE